MAATSEQFDTTDYAEVKDTLSVMCPVEINMALHDVRGCDNNPINISNNDVYSYAVTPRPRVIFLDGNDRMDVVQMQTCRVTNKPGQDRFGTSGVHAYQSLQKHVAASNMWLSWHRNKTTKCIGAIITMMLVAVGTFLFGLYIGTHINTEGPEAHASPLDLKYSVFELHTTSTENYSINTAPSVCGNNTELPQTTYEGIISSTLSDFTSARTPIVWCSHFGEYICAPDGWLVWLRRVNNSVSFNQTWDEYRNGFGNKMGNFWLGLEELSNITESGGRASFRSEMTSWKGEQKWVEYGYFSVSNETNNYTLKVGEYNENSNTPDKFGYNNGSRFTTVDRDNDLCACNCADVAAGGGWWYNYCSYIIPTAVIGREGDRWYPFMSSDEAFDGDRYQAIKYLTMMVKLI